MQKQMGLSSLEMAALVYKERQKPQYVRVKFQDEESWGLKPGVTSAYPPLGMKRSQYDIWYPYPWECRPCCSKMAMPPRNIPWAYKRHCKTYTHIAELFLVDELELRKAVGTHKRVAPKCANCARFCKASDFLCGSCRFKENRS